MQAHLVTKEEINHREQVRIKLDTFKASRLTHESYALITSIAGMISDNEVNIKKQLDDIKSSFAAVEKADFIRRFDEYVAKCNEWALKTVSLIKHTHYQLQGCQKKFESLKDDEDPAMHKIFRKLSRKISFEISEQNNMSELLKNTQSMIKTAFQYYAAELNELRAKHNGVEQVKFFKPANVLSKDLNKPSPRSMLQSGAGDGASTTHRR